MATDALGLRLQSLVDELATTQRLHETVVTQIEGSDDKLPTEAQSEMIAGYRDKEKALGDEMANVTEDIERRNRVIESSKRVQRAMAGGHEGIDEDGDHIAYRSMHRFARDVILTSQTPYAQRVQSMLGDQAEITKARERLQLAKRTPDNTLSTDIEGISAPQHIAQIFQVIQTARPLVASAIQANLNRGKVTYPLVNSRPVVEVQTAEKTEAGNTKMDISLEDLNADVFLGGGDISWQAVNWSDPNALDLWFRFAASDYAYKTERAAAHTLEHSAYHHVISSPLGATPSFADFMAAVGRGYAKVFTDSERIANTIYVAPDRFGYLLGLTSDAFTQFTTVNGQQVGPLNIIVSRGMDAGSIAVGDREGLLVAETPNAPVDLQVTEPAIGGYEVGLIGGFASVVVDDGAFSLLTTAS